MTEIDGRVTLAVLGEKLGQVVQRVEVLIVLVDHLVASGHRRDEDAVAVRLALQAFEKVEIRLVVAENDIEEMQPWVKGMRWFVLILGGVLALAVVAGILWAAAKAAGLMP